MQGAALPANMGSVGGGEAASSTFPPPRGPLLPPRAQRELDRGRDSTAGLWQDLK